MALGLPTSAAVTIGGSLALSSSAFVLQLLKDKNQMGTRAGKASFGILLLQDLAVVPLLVVVELLAKGGTGLGKALSIAGPSHFRDKMRCFDRPDSCLPANFPCNCT
jgi:monovalent cation:H+ antiporter-2, CPA2 family